MFLNLIWQNIPKCRSMLNNNIWFNSHRLETAPHQRRRLFTGRVRFRCGGYKKEPSIVANKSTNKCPHSAHTIPGAGNKSRSRFGRRGRYAERSTGKSVIKEALNTRNTTPTNAQLHPLSAIWTISTISATVSGPTVAHWCANEGVSRQAAVRRGGDPPKVLPPLFTIHFYINDVSSGFRCKGDVLQAMELMVSGTHEEVSAPSAFSPLGPPPNFHRYSPSRRFLSAPYAGTGYLPTVIRPPPTICRW